MVWGMVNTSTWHLNLVSTLITIKIMTHRKVKYWKSGYFWLFPGNHGNLLKTKSSPSIIKGWDMVKPSIWHIKWMSLLNRNRNMTYSGGNYRKSGYISLICGYHGNPLGIKLITIPWWNGAQCALHFDTLSQFLSLFPRKIWWINLHQFW